MANKDTLVQKRGRIKSKITRIENYVVANELNFAIDLNELIIRESMLIKTYADYEDIQDQFEEQEATHEDDRVVVESQYVSLHSNLKTLIVFRSNMGNSANSFGSNAVSARVGNAVASPMFSTPQVKLPNINIHIFSGKYEDYMSFSELFISLIDSDNYLNKVQKFLYLKSVLREEPLLMVKDLQIRDANYDIALELLRKRYDNKLVTINYHIRVLMESQVAKGTSGSLRDFIVKIKQNYNALGALGVPVKE